MKISQHFELEEFLITENRKFLAKNISEGSKPEVTEKLAQLATTVLEPIREYFGKPLHVNSGYRCTALNTAVGGAKESQHILAEAADIIIPGVGLDKIFAFVRGSGLPYGQLIYEFGAWIHVSLGEPFRSSAQCRQNMVAFKNGVNRTVYKHVPNGISPVGYRG